MQYGAITIDKDIMNGAPVFANTEVPVQAFLEYLEDGKSMTDFLADYPEVNQSQAVEVMQMLKFLVTSEDVLRSKFVRP